MARRKPAIVDHRLQLPSEATAPRQIPSLDGLRGVAILMVMLFHFARPDKLSGKAGEVFLAIARRGGAGVNLFFVLSGFLITGILYRTKDQAHYFRNFYARRALRIFPLYYGVLAVSLILVPLIRMPSDPKFQFTVHHQIWLWVYCSNIFETINGRALPLFGHFWSLAVEEHFYLVWPVVILVSRRATILRICVSCGIAAFGLRVLLLHLGASPAIALVRLTPCQIDSLAIGGFVAVAGGAERASAWVPTAWRVAIGACAVGIVLHTAGSESFALASLAYTCWAFFFAGILVLSLGLKRGALLAFLRYPLMRSIGKYSYALYVFHWPVGRVLIGAEPALAARFPAMNSIGGFTFQLLFLGLGIGLSSIGARISWHLYESRFLRFKRFFA